MRVRLLLLALVAAAALAGCGSSSSSSGGSGSPGAAATGTARRPARALRHVPALSLPARPVARSVVVPILTWHRVTSFAQELVKSIPDETVEPAVFASEIEAIAAHGLHPISQLQLYDALFRGRPLPPHPVLLTVDDGYVDDVRTVLPILERHHFVATFYVITGRYHEPGFLNPAAVRRLDAAGMDVGAHTRDHVPLNAVPTAQMKEEIIGSRNDLVRVLHHPVPWFAYPYGAFDAGVVQEVRRAGFVLAVTTMGGTTESSLAPLTMPRIHIGRSATAATVLSCMAAPRACGGGGG